MIISSSSISIIISSSSNNNNNINNNNNSSNFSSSSSLSSNFSRTESISAVAYKGSPMWRNVLRLVVLESNVGTDYIDQVKRFVFSSNLILRFPGRKHIIINLVLFAPHFDRFRPYSQWGKNRYFLSTMWVVYLTLKTVILPDITWSLCYNSLVPCVQKLAFCWFTTQQNNKWHVTFIKWLLSRRSFIY